MVLKKNYQLALPPHIEDKKVNITSKPGLYENIFDVIERLKDLPEDKYIWSGIKKGNFGYVFGPSKSGKTILCENLGMAIATNQASYLGLPLNLEGINNVLFVSMEEYITQRTRRNAKQVHALGVTTKEEFPYSVINESFPKSMDSKESWIKLEEVIVKSEADFVIIDSLTRLTYDEVEKSHVATKLSQKLRDLTYSLGITMVVVHHSSKLNNSPIELHALAGSRVIGQEADFIIGVNKLSNNRRYVKEVALRYKQESENVYTFQIDNNLWLQNQGSISEERLFERSDLRRDTSTKDLVVDTIKDNINGSNQISTNSLIEILDTKEVAKSSRAYEILEDLGKDGVISRERGLIKLL